MIKTVSIALLLTLVGSAEGFTMDTLSELRWQKRVVLVFGDTGDERIARQIAELAKNPAELTDRDLAVLTISGDRVDTIATPAQHLTKDAGAADRLRHEGEIAANSFAVLLVGKDGGIKLRKSGVVEPAEIFALIDSMPMRQSEQRSN